MTYELAKELEAAHFPFQFTESNDPSKGHKYNAPTLSKLIEACGNSFSRLVHSPVLELWEADGVSTNGTDHTTLFMKGGSTPEEAVARLWLAVNKK